MGYFEDKSLSFAFASQNELMSKLVIQLFGFLTLHNSLAPLMLVASDPTVLVLFCGLGFPVACLCCAPEHDRIIAPNEGVFKAPNRGNKILTISFMRLKSTLVANQELSLEEGTGLWPVPMTTILEQDNQIANLKSLTNEITPGTGAILLPWNPSTQIPWARFS
ncbi:hypothetical protein DSO57_1014370 [Entomophthora muscae]|uniref:Uncharacterized protein n=1 Tax=Entomophthora muscae TaxID=34485 RepID=A0ACC2SU98_9FUNG|nr:hypothetical protein DSO57_1014370 [Entomophthora muscae]